MTALTEHIRRHALSYLIALLLGCTASLTAVYDNFWSVEPADMAALGWWQVLALVCKCGAGGATAIVGYLIKSPVQDRTLNAQPSTPNSSDDPFAKL